MKRNFLMFLPLAATSMLLIACGGAEESTDDTADTAEVVPAFADQCTGESDITFKVDRYGYQFDSTYVDDTKIEVVRSTWEMKNDSVAELNIYNYEEGATDTTSNYQITAKLKSHNGNKIGPAQYPYSGGHGSDYSLSLTISNSIGKVYFNWYSGMPDQGYLELTFADADGACGSFNLEVNKPELITYGHVELKGNFSTL